VKHTVILSFVIATTAITACSAPGSVPSNPTNGVGSSAPASNVALSSANTRAVASLKSGTSTLYVLNGDNGKNDVVVYAQSGAKYLRSISNAGGPLAVDTHRHLFLPITGSGHDYTLNVYAKQGAKVVQTLSSTHPFYFPTVDSSGNLFVVCATLRVCEYPPDAKTVVKKDIIRKIQLKGFAGGVGALATDQSGDLAVDAGGSVVVFPPKAKSPTWTIPNLDPTAMAFDTLGNLYVGIEGNQNASVEVFAPGATSPMLTITDGYGSTPVALALDQSNNLYVLTGTAGSAFVSVYAYGTTNPAFEITSGLVAGTNHSLAVSPAGELFVSNSNLEGNVVVYPSGQTSPKITVTKNLNVPTEVGVSPT
jgi:hypothetical protein